MCSWNSQAVRKFLLRRVQNYLMLEKWEMSVNRRSRGVLSNNSSRVTRPRREDGYGLKQVH
jgi:hypothetical protein